MKKKKLFIGLILFALACVFFYVYNEYNRKVKSLANASPDFVIRDTSLIAEFINHEEQSTGKYLDKVILVTGNITSLDTSSGRVTINLGSTGSPYSVKCQLDSSQTILTPGIGASSSIKGLFIGFNRDTLIGSDILLSKCIIINDK